MIYSLSSGMIKKKKKKTAKTFRYPPLFLGHAVMFSMSVKLYIYPVICFYPDFRPTLIIDNLVLSFVWVS